MLAMTDVQPEGLPPVQEVMLEQVLAALADPVRLTIVRTLAAWQGSWCSDLYAAVTPGIGRSTFSHHTKVLREAGIIRVRVSGTRRLVALRTDELNQRFPGLIDVIVDSAPRPQPQPQPSGLDN